MFLVFEITHAMVNCSLPSVGEKVKPYILIGLC